MRLSSRLPYLLALSGAFFVACGDDEGGPGDTGQGDTDSQPDTTDTTDTDLPPDTVDTVDTTDTDTTELPDTVDTTDTQDDVDTTDTTDADTTPPIPEPDVVVDMSLCSTSGPFNVYDLQNKDCPRHPAEGQEVTLNGIVITGTFPYNTDTMTAQDSRGGPYSGITLYRGGSSFNVGDVVDIKGTYVEFFENTQVTVSEITKRGTTTPLDPYVAAHPAHLRTNGPLAEMFEGVLVRVEDVATIHTQPDCPFDYGEFEVTGGLRVDDMGVQWKALDTCTKPCARLGDTFDSITGPLLFTFGNHKIEPRTMADLAFTNKGASNGVSKCTATECRAREDAIVTRTVVINEIMADPFGEDTHQEWIELYNPGNTTVNLGGWALRDCGAQVITFFGPDAVIPPRDYLVVGVTKNQTLNLGVPVDYEYGSNFYLPNTVGSVLLYDGEGPQATLIDQARYSRFETWADIFRTGYSLERKTATSDGTQVGSWQRATKRFGSGDNRGTPGARNGN